MRKPVKIILISSFSIFITAFISFGFFLAYRFLSSIDFQPNEDGLSTNLESSDYDEFAMYLTGMPVYDNNMSEYLINKRNTLREYYSLPEVLLDSDSEDISEYANVLQSLASEYNVSLRKDLDSYLLSKGFAVGVARGIFVKEDNSMHVKKDFSFDKIGDVRVFEHELIHAMQEDMDIEEMEFEAYLCTEGSDHVIRDPETRESVLFSKMYDSSVAWYEGMGLRVPWKGFD